MMPRSKGFTLLELLVVMALLSLVMLGLVSAMRTMAQTQERVDQRLQRADEFRVATQFLQQILGRASGRRMRRTGVEDGAANFWFHGETNTIAWVGAMPARHGAGGLTFFRLAVEECEGADCLVLRFAPWTDTEGFPDWSNAQSRVLVPDVTGFSVQYQDARDLSFAWQTSWSATERIPDRLRLLIQTRTGHWPVWIIAVRAFSLTERSRELFSSGGGG